MQAKSDQYCSLQACPDINRAPSEHSLILLLKACTDLNKGRVIHAVASKNGKDSNAYVASCLVNMYAKLGSIGEARLVFDGMPYHDVVSWTALVQGYAANGEGQTALELFAQMQCQGFLPNARTLVAVLKACIGRFEVLQMALAIQAQVLVLGLCKDLLVATTLVDVYAKCAYLQHACRVFGEMQFHDLVAWNALMFGFVDNGEGEMAVQLLAEMALSHCTPNSRSFIAALKACACLAAKGNAMKANSLNKVRAIHSQASRHLDSLLSNTLVDVYAKCGSIQEARRVFDKMPAHDVVSWSALILGYVENGEYTEALELFARSTCAPNSVVFLAVTRACVGLAVNEGGLQLQEKVVKVDALHRGRAVEDQASRTGCDLDIAFKNSLIDMYGKCGSMADAWRVFNSMCEHDVVSWNSLLFGYVDSGDWDLALCLFSRLLLGGFTPNARTLVAASKACTSLAALEREEMQADRKQLRRASLPLQKGYAIHSMSLISCLDTESVLSSCLIDMYSKAGSMEEAHRVFNNMFQPDLAAWTSLMLGYAENGEGKVALQLFGQMQRESTVPDSRAYVAALKACNVEAALETGRGIHMDIRRLHPEMETETYVASALVDFYCKCGSMLEAEAVFSKVSPKNLVTWNTLMAGYGRNGYPERVLEKFHEMRDEGLRPDRVTFLCVLTTCSHAGLVATGQECFESMEVKYGVIPDVEHYTCMVDLLGRVNEIEAALSMVKRMPCKPDGVTWRSLLGSPTGQLMKKAIFVVFFSGERAQSKVIKICDAFGANRYPYPEEPSRQRQMRSEVAGRLSELKSTLDAGTSHRDAVLAGISYQLDFWILMVQREKAIYHTLNKFNMDVTRKCLVGEAWCPSDTRSQVQEALMRATLDSNSQVGTIFQELKTKELPPTYFRTNKITGAFQGIVDAYGIARYKEANPAVFTVVTFPFLFAVMFGDWGHGVVLLLATLYLIMNERRLGSQKLGDIMGMAFGGRYVIMLMSVFSIYTGFIYNEFFSVPFHIFGDSAYSCRDPSCKDAGTAGLIKRKGYTYPFGLDPVWHGSRSELSFTNSVKMKMSILLGVMHMNVGLILSYYNASYFNEPLDIWYQFLPQILFLGSLFGYLSILIIIKWCSGSQADLYHVMIYMFLSPTEDLGGNQLFWGQTGVQCVLLLIAFVCVPMMLLPKPLALKREHEERMHGRSYGILNAGSDGESADTEHDHHEHGEEEFEFGEILVHQMIETIEFVLGTVSNTASYLRLWALSLAHAQLSAVFYDKVLLLAWSYNNTMILILGGIVFAFATIGVLLIMETLSAFLHALRLHWVEFQGKFYAGDGYQFHPFSFATLDEEEQ